MVFSSPLFLFLFLPVFLVAYYSLPSKAQIYVILIGSWVFYAAWRVDFLCLVILVSLWNYGIGSYIHANKEDSRKSRFGVIWSVIVNLSVLGYFKYFNFGLESVNQILNFLGITRFPAAGVTLPVGISFYIFQSMSYSIDVYREDAEPAENFITLAAYVALFPQLIAGPILRYKDIADQLKARETGASLFGQGFVLFLFGFCRKVLLADSVASLVDTVFQAGSPSFLESWIGTAAYAVQLYFDFSGYSDMAIGLGMMLGFHFKKNFNAPYKALSITEFWQLWHISLSSWLRDYLYIPLGGNRLSPARTYLNLFLVMALGGLWHGASWTFIIWGCWHGFWLMLERRFPSVCMGGGWGWLKTMAIVLIGWIFFRAETLTRGLDLLKGAFGFSGWGVSPSVSWQLSPSALFVMALGVLVIAWEKKYRGEGASRQTYVFSFSQSLALVVLFIGAVLKILSDSYSPFLYFRF